MRSGPGAARTILLFHTISARPSEQPRMVGSTLGVYIFGLILVSARTNKRHHHHQKGLLSTSEGEEAKSRRHMLLNMLSQEQFLAGHRVIGTKLMSCE